MAARYHRRGEGAQGGEEGEPKKSQPLSLFLVLQVFPALPDKWGDLPAEWQGALADDHTAPPRLEALQELARGEVPARWQHIASLVAMVEDVRLRAIPPYRILSTLNPQY